MKPETSQFACPGCQQPLRLEPIRLWPDENAVIVWCGYGPCHSFEADKGAVGKTEQDAYEGLRNAIEQEREKGRE